MSGSLRIDRLLWFLRFAKTRGLAQRWVAEGHIRANGHRVEKANHAIFPGDILVFPLGLTVRAIEVIALPERRGPAPEAQACYRVLDDGGASPLAGQQIAKS